MLCYDYYRYIVIVMQPPSKCAIKGLPILRITERVIRLTFKFSATQGCSSFFKGVKTPARRELAPISARVAANRTVLRTNIVSRYVLCGVRGE